MGGFAAFVRINLCTHLDLIFDGNDDYVFFYSFSAVFPRPTMLIAALCTILPSKHSPKSGGWDN